MLQKMVSWAGLMTVILLYFEVGGLFPNDFGLYLKCSHFEAELKIKEVNMEGRYASTFKEGWKGVGALWSA